jgi:hypothetical protein
LKSAKEHDATATPTSAKKKKTCAVVKPIGDHFESVNQNFCWRKDRLRPVDSFRLTFRVVGSVRKNIFRSFRVLSSCSFWRNSRLERCRSSGTCTIKPGLPDSLF